MAGKRIMIVLLLGIMMLVYVPGLSAKEAAAKEAVAEEGDEAAAEEDGTEEEITNHQGDVEGEPEEEAEEEQEEESEEEQEEDPDEESEDPEEPPTPEKVWEAFKIQIAEPDGAAGYYITKPNIVIHHMDEQGSTNYILINENSEIIKGSISGKGKQTTIPANTLKQGIHRLVVYMNNDNGERLEDGTGKYRVEKEIWIDTIAPEVEVTAPSGFESWYQDTAILTIKANDTFSGTDEIRYYVNGLQVKTETLQGKNASSQFLVIPPSDKGQKIPVKIEVLDQAGNLAVINKGVYVDKQDPQITVTGAFHHEITSRDIELKVQTLDENGIASWRMTGERETTDGSIQPLEQTGEKTVHLSEEGIYRMKFQAVDLAGRSSTTSLQVIIDKTDPVIRLIDELEGAYIREFRLNVSKEEMIEDFTSYELAMSLNGRLYNAQETIYEEGQQLLKVQVKDAAGNEAKTEARFTIDRTKPEIVFTGITDGQEFEGEAEVEIEVENQEDTLEDVRVNGRKMTVEAGAFQGVFKDVGEYKVTAVAVDKAGNTMKESIAFSVISEEKVLSTASGMFSQILGKEMLENEEGEVKMKQLKIVMLVIPLLIVGIILGVIAFYKLRKLPR